MRTEKRKMTFVKFAEYAQAEAAALVATPDPERTALLKAAMTAAAAAADQSAEIEVDVPAPDPVAVDLAAVHAKLDKLTAAVEAFAGGVTAKAAFDAVVTKQGVAVSLAVELINGHIMAVQEIAGKLQAGGEDIDRESLWQKINAYNVSQAVEDALTVLGKADAPPDAALAAEVGAALKAAYVAKAGTDEAARKAAEEAAAKAAADKAAADAAATEEVCKQCGAKMKKADQVCPACGWERGTPVTTKSAKPHKHPERYLAKKQGK